MEIIEYDLFKNSEIESITIPSNFTEIRISSFENCLNLKHVNFEKNSLLENIGLSAFYYTSIETIMIPSHVMEIEIEAFAECINLKQVCFSENSELKKIQLHSGIQEFEKYQFHQMYLLSMKAFLYIVQILKKSILTKNKI